MNWGSIILFVGVSSVILLYLYCVGYYLFSDASGYTQYKSHRVDGMSKRDMIQ
jgi:hypothetical protein